MYLVLYCRLFLPTSLDQKRLRPVRPALIPEVPMQSRTPLLSKKEEKSIPNCVREYDEQGILFQDFNCA